MSSQGLIVGPYNLTATLPGFNAIGVVGPIVGSEGVNHVSYMVGIAEGNNTTPSDSARRIIVDITKFSLPIDIEDKVLLSEAYDATVAIVYPDIVWDIKDQVMIDDKLAEHRYNNTNVLHFICYFANPNLKVTVGERNLSTEEFTEILRTLHVD
jgi:hypothetical protein